jgi:hypothetical protein
LSITTWKNKRCDQGEDLQHEGDQQHFAEQFAVLDHRRDEPGEVELRQFAGQRGARGEQDQFAAPARFELGQRQHLGALGARVLDQDFLLIDAGEDDEAAVFLDGQRRQRGLRQAGGIGGDLFRLEPEPLRGEQDLRHAEALARLAKVVGQLVGVGGDVVEARQHDEAEEAGVAEWRRLLLLVCGCDDTGNRGDDTPPPAFCIMFIALRPARPGSLPRIAIRCGAVSQE